MRTIRYLLFILFTITIVYNPFLLGIDPSKPFNHFQHNVFTSENGLPMNSVLCLAQTPDGFIWVGTETGLARFDGITFEVYNRENVPMMKNDLIRVLLVDRHETLWIGTRGGGVIQYKNGIFEMFPTNNLISSIIWAITETRDGSIWIGSSKGGIRYIEGKIEKIPLPPDATSVDIRSITEDQNGQIWVGTLAGLIVVKKKGEVFVSEFKGFENIKVNTILEDRTGTIWVGTLEKGLLRLIQEKYNFFNRKNGLASNNIQCLTEDFSGNLWIGTYGGGIYFKQASSNKIHRFDKDNDLASNSILAFLEDREKILWIGTEGGGLSNLRESKVITYTKKNGLSHDIVFTLFEDSQGGVWTGTMGFGIDCLKNGKVQNITQEKGLSSNSILSFAEYPEGWLWIGTRIGANRMHLKTAHFDVFTTLEGLSDNTVRALYVDPDGIFWAGTGEGGLHKFINDRFQLVKKIPYRINTIFKDNQQSLWIGTWGNGLYQLRNNTFQVFNKKNGFESDVVLAIYQDENDGMWIGTHYSGLIHFKDRTFTTITKKAGLHDNTIYNIIEDDKNNFWMSSNNGIISISRLELEKFVRNNKYILQPTVFTKEDGMRSTECNGGGQPAGLLSRNGQIWFPTTKGISMIDPEHIGINTLPPPVVIKKFLVNGKRYPMDNQKPIYSWENGVDIHYTALSFIVPEKVRFKTKLTGYNKEWVDAGTSRVTKYTDLPPGKYAFSVIASNSDGTWNLKGKTFEFYLKPKLLQTFVFKIVLLLFLLILTGGLYLLGKKIKQIRNMRKKFQLSFLDKEKKEEYIRKIFYLIEMKEIYKDPDLSLNTFAQEIDLNPRYLSQLINNELKMGFLDLINSYRIKEAKELIADPKHKNMSVLEVSMEAGFNSKSSFNRAFKKFAKLTPSEFKKKYHHS